MFKDHVKLKLSGGKGGNGIVAWLRVKYLPKGGPAGGNGGRGGSIIITADPSINSLDSFRNRAQIDAPKGQAGGGNNRQGKKGKDLILKVPCGTLLLDAHTQTLIHDFKEPGERLKICSGGKGGLGNTFFKTATCQAPSKCTLGREGEMRDVELKLKLIADIGLVGVPNAGKSTLLNQIAPIRVKTAAYPFTTLDPQISYIDFDDFSRLYIADIPGIITDAHADRGLGLSFLRHIERCSALIFVIDIAGVDGQNPFQDFLTLRREIQRYMPLILEKPFVVALNKVDHEGAKKHLEPFKKEYPFDPSTLFEISALEKKGLGLLIERVRNLRNKKIFFPK